MINPARLILEYGKRGSPLGKSILEEEFPSLVANLQERLGASPEVLNLSPDSLNILAPLLLSYYQREFLGIKEDDEEEIVRMIREIAAYIGRVILKNSKGKLQTWGGLWGTEIVFEGPVKSIKGSQTITHKQGVVSLGQIASSTWTALQMGVEPKLYRTFQLSVAKNVREEY